MSQPEFVLVRLPARPDGLPHARVVAVSCGTLANLSMDRIDDLRQCTQEALAVLLDDGDGDHLELKFGIVEGSVTVIGRRHAAARRDPDPTSFAWLLLTELAAEAAATFDGDYLLVEFTIAEHPVRSGRQHARQP